MTVTPKQDGPILVTGAAGEVGSVGREITRLLIADGFRVRAMVRRQDARADALRAMGADVVMGGLTDLDAMHRVIAGCRRVYFGMSVSPATWRRPWACMPSWRGTSMRSDRCDAEGRRRRFASETPPSRRRQATDAT